VKSIGYLSKRSVCRSLILVLTTVVAIPAGFGQGVGTDTTVPQIRTERVSFEVATIKPFDPAKNPGATSYMDFKPPVLKIGGSLESFLELAYDVKAAQIVGGRAWVKNSLYDIVAKLPFAADPKQGKAMFQTLLEDRFKLAVHSEARSGGEYSLVVTKGGVRMKPADAKGPAEAKIGPGMRRVRGQMSAAELASQLSTTLGHPVVDHSGLSGSYNIDLTWAGDDQADGPSVFTAIQEQLGLKLEPVQGSIQVVVIDHVERPSEN
jgi:uncharacterized protein (TIGR03435 family)